MKKIIELNNNKDKYNIALNSNKINNIDDDNYIKQTHEFISNYFD